MPVLITGGAGYIGAHLTRLLRDRGDTVVVVDDLSSGEADRVGDAPLEVLDLTAADAPRRLAEVIDRYGVTGIVHLAALKQVGESAAMPARYYRDNIAGLASVVEAAAATGVDRLVFSSSAAVYGAPSSSAVSEDAPAAPINPYGETKLAGEWLVRAAATAHGIDSISLRYFNVAGAGWDDLGDPLPLNLITIAIDRLRRGERPVVFGDGYPTADGTGVRDYVHVLDLASAHVAALDDLDRATAGAPRARVFNVGTGAGSSVLEVLERLGAAAGVEIDPIIEAPRAGDAAEVVADVARIHAELGWRARFDLDDMVASAWRAAEHRAGSLR